MPEPIRVLTAVPLCDGHDSAINTINLELVRHGIEVIYLGYHRPARDVVRAALQEGVRAVGLSSYNGGHVEYFSSVVRGLKKAGAADVTVFGGGGGTITSADERVMRRNGVDRIFFAGTPLDEITKYVSHGLGRSKSRGGKAGRNVNANPDRALAERLIRLARNGAGRRGVRGETKVIGLTGPGGAGKTTLIDELVLRFLKATPKSSRIAILSHDPSIVNAGALLGDRAAMIHSQNDRVFMHSLASRGRAGGLAPNTEACIEELRGAGFALVIVETVGTGQEAAPFIDGAADLSVFVMSPEYGSRLQLQKIAMLDVADVIVINKSDLAGGERACAEVSDRVAMAHADRPVIATVAKRHRDAGVNSLFDSLMAKVGIEADCGIDRGAMMAEA